MVTSLYSQYGFPQLYSRPSRPSILHNQIQPCTVQPPWSRPLYSQYGLLHCTKQIQPFLYNFPQSRHYGFQRLTAGHYCTAWHSRPLRPLYSHYGFPRHTAGHCGLVIVRPGTVGHKDLASVQQSMAVNNKALGKPYSEHALAAPGSEARSDLTCTSLQYLATEPGLQALSDLTCTSLQCLATEPGLQALCEHVQAAPGAKARSDLTCTILQCLATEPGLQALCEHVQAAPGSKARSDLTCTSLQYLATEPGLSFLCEQYLVDQIMSQTN